MQRHSLTVGGEHFVLDPRTDIDHLRHDIEDAVRAGGRFVSVTLYDSSDTSVLMSPGLFVSLTTVSHDERANNSEELPARELITYDYPELYGMPTL